MWQGVVKYRKILVILLLPWLFSGPPAFGAPEEVIPLRLVAIIDRDDQGDSFEFPTALFYDYWASEIYLVSSTDRVTIYDQQYFPVASFGIGRGMTSPKGLAVDRHGLIYVCQAADAGRARPPRVVVYNQAFFPVREITFTDIPELPGFAPDKVAVAESGEIYLIGGLANEHLPGVAVLSPEGKFLRILPPPENDVLRPAKKVVAAADKGEAKVAPASPAGDVEDVEDTPDLAALLPGGLKPKAAAPPADQDEEKMQMGPATIADIKIDRQGRIYLLSREVSFIYVLNAQEEYLFKFGEKGGVDGKLSNPVSLAVDLERRVIYVCDYMRHTILCYDYDSGKFIFEFGGRGLGAMWFNFPNSVEVDQRGRVWISDLFNRRVQVIDPSITARRPLNVGRSGAAPEVVPEVVPAPDNERPLPPQAELATPAAFALPGPVSLVTLPPAAVAILPSLLPPPAMRVPPVLPRSPLLRELTPARVKKLPAPAGPPLQILSVAAVRSPARFPRPVAVRVLNKERGLRASGVAGERAGGILARFRAMPAAIGVYGPVAALLGVGSWLLYIND